MKTDNPVVKDSLTAPEAFAALIEGKRLKDKTGRIFGGLDENLDISLRALVNWAPYTIIEDKKEPELPEYLASVIEEAFPGRCCDGGDLVKAILRACDERIGKAMAQHFLEYHNKADDVDQRIAKAIKEHETNKILKSVGIP